MSSTLTFKKQIPSDTPYFIALSSFQKKIMSKTSGSSGNYGPGTISGATYSATGLDASYVPINSIMRDLGKTVVSSGRAFRYVQLVAPGLTGANGLSTANGIGGSSTTATTNGDDIYHCFYAEVPLNGAIRGAALATTTLGSGAYTPDPIIRYG
jgi:hypothetical protein